MKRIALLTWSALKELTPGDQLLAAKLRALGHDVRAVAWDVDPEPGAGDLVIIRSPWNYYLEYPRFMAFLTRIVAAGAELWNPLPLVEWNSKKHYLRELESRGIRIPPTRWLERGSGVDVLAALRGAGFSEAVVKPAIAAGAHETFRIRADDEAQRARLNALLERHDLMLQPFLREVVDDGEWSFIFIRGELLASLKKRPKVGDFRVQPQHGGQTEAIAAPPPGLVEDARAVLARIPTDWLYARVDGVAGADGRLTLMELEVIEPNLFFDLVPRACETMARAVSGLASR